MSTDWTQQQLGKVLTLNYGWSLAAKNRIEGEFPVYGSNGVVGSHNKPLVPTAGLIVGRKGSAGNVHLSRKPFCPIDTTFYVAPSDTTLDLEFLYYLLLHLDLKRITGDVGVPGLNREMAYFEPCSFPTSQAEQQKIAAVLGVVQRAMEQQERLLALTAELKKTLLHQLFTQGLSHEPQKQTEIGLLPASWRVVKMDDVCEDITVGIVVRPSSHYVENGVPALRSQNVRRDRIQMEPMICISREAHEGIVAKSRINAGDVLIVRTGANLGMSAVVPESLDGSNCIDLIIMRPTRSMIDGRFLSRFINSAAAQTQVHAGKIGLAQQHYNVGTVKSTLMPLPPLEEQREIVAVFEQIDAKCDYHQHKHATLTALFRTLLHQLMTAQIRVGELDLSEFRQTMI